MVRQGYPFQVAVAIALVSALLLGLGTAGAVIVYRQQRVTAEALGENIGSRKAAAQLEEGLADLIALHQNRAAQVAPLHERIAHHLEQIRKLADKDEEKRLAGELAASFARYQGNWEADAGDPQKA